jgi:hypothetical protein
MTIFRVISAKMIGIGFMKNYLNDIVTWVAIEKVLAKNAEAVKKEIIRRAPRKTGLMESNVRISKSRDIDSTTFTIYIPIGIDPENPLYPLATEFGTRTIQVGTPESPRTSWVTKSKAGATMPYMRPAAYKFRKKIIEQIENVIYTKITVTMPMNIARWI